MKIKITFLITLSIALLSLDCNSINDNTKSFVANSASKPLQNTKQQPTPTIESVVSDKYVTPITSINNSPGEAANLILDALNQWAAIKCSQTIDASLGAKWQETKLKYIGIIPAGSTVEFLVLVNKFNCNVIGLVHKTQTVRVKDNVCSVNDINLESRDLITDPDQTGFFSIKIKF